jgi:hypothetical protein
LLEKAHIDWYWEDILKARRNALADIQTARLFAKEVNCAGCEFCGYLLRHEEVLGRTAADLILIVDSLSEGMRSEMSFPRTFTHDTTIYRGFITHDGRYIGITGNMDHDRRWQMYAEECGKEQAYRLIKVSGSYGINRKAQVIFSDRKAPPSKEQYTTLKNLMIEAQGELCFRFAYDPSHPH